MSPRNRTVVSLVGLAVVLALVLTACAPGGQPTPAPKQAPPAATAPAGKPAAAPSPPAARPAVTPAAAGAPKTGGTLNLQSVGPAALDPHRSGAINWSIPSYGAVYESLVRMSDEKEYGKLEVKPFLAESWKQDNPTTYTFALRKGVNWQKVPPVNGREFTSDDVVYSMKRLTQLGIQPPDGRFVMAALFDELVSIEAVDKYTVKMITKYASYPFLMKLGLADGSVIIPKELSFEALANNVVGTGPFLLDSFNRDSTTRMKRNPDYWDKGKPYMDRITVHHLSDPNAMQAAMRTGRLDIVDLIETQVASLSKTNPEIKIERYPGNQQAGIGLQSERKPFNDKRMRQAVRYGLDMQVFIDIMLNGQGKPNPALWWWMDYALPESEIPKRDVAKAKKLVVDAGYPNGVKVVALAASSRPETTKILEIAKDQLKDVGIDVQITALDEARLRVIRNQQSDFDMYSYATTAHEIPERFHKAFVYGKSTYNFARFKNDEVDALILAAEKATTAEERGKALIAYQRKVLEEVPYVWLYTPYSYTANQPYVRGYRNSVQRTGRWQTIPNFWLDK
ncbi:MAG: ABC transporter substrate-binding protein [Chloroflexi bacterium]|nr:ABC transporter substrate-binding protein [Chloroflexota bacterium]